MKRRKAFIFIITGLLMALVLSSCASAPKKTALRVIIIPKFEVGKITGDSLGEAQLFYEQYCAGCEEAEIPHLPETAHCYVNEKTGTAVLVTDSGKAKAGLSLMALLSCDRYDCSNAYIVSVGCGGGSLGDAILGDVVVVTAACDYDLGHHVDSREVTEPNNAVTWFPDEDYADQAYKPLNAELSEKVYQMIKDCPLQTTEMAKQWMAENFPNWDRAAENTETLDIFEPAMHNLFDASRIVIDAILEGEF